MPTDDAALRRKAVSGEAWAEFCDTLKAAGSIVVDNCDDDLDRLEGFRYLSRLTRGALDSYLEGGDTSFPVLGAIPNMVKIGCDNPDALYQRVNVSPHHRYRIAGRRGTVNYLGIGAYSGGYQTGASRPAQQGYVEDNDPDDAATVDLVVARDRPDTLAPGQRWLEMGTATSIVMIRQFFLDRTTERPADLRIECLDPPTPTPEPLHARHLVHGLTMSGLFVQGCAEMFLGWVHDQFLARPNTLDFLVDDDLAAGWSDPNQLFRHGYWALEPGQALVVDVPAIAAYYWNFQLNNLWEESLDYRFLSVTVNKHTARYEPDGTARIIVSEADPGVGNWMDPAGHRHGTFGLRYNQVVEDRAPTCTVVDAAALA
jgi:hypothetical protein